MRCRQYNVRMKIVESKLLYDQYHASRLQHLNDTKERTTDESLYCIVDCMKIIYVAKNVKGSVALLFVSFMYHYSSRT